MTKNKSTKQGPHKMRQFHKMVTKLHEMLQLLGQQNPGNSVIKLDEFEKLRKAFTSAAELYEKSNNQIKSMSDRVRRAELMFRIIQSKRTMDGCLLQMTTISIRLKQKLSKQNFRQNDKLKTAEKKKKDEWEAPEDIIISDKIQQPQEQNQGKNPLQKQLQYKTLVLYNLQRTYSRLVQTERKQVASAKKDIIKNNFAGLQELKKDAERRKLIQQIEEETLDKEEQLEQEEILHAIKRLDDEIEAKLAIILEDLQKMHGHALGISDSIGDVHKLILVNLQNTEKNEEELKEAKKMLDKVSVHARKPSCICNVVLCFFLALIAFLLLKLFGVFDNNNNVTPN